MKFKKDELILLLVSILLSVASTVFFYQRNELLAYGDAVSHLNIAKRVVSGLTPGLGQLGSVWLPLQHLMMLPFVWNDFLWRSGLGGSVVSMACFVGSNFYIYKTVRLYGGNLLSGILAVIIFSLNPNVLYLQSVPMGEIPLIFFLIASLYFFARWLMRGNIGSLILAGFFTCCGSLIRYDAWFLAGFQTLAIVAHHFFRYEKRSKTESRLILNGAIAYLGVFSWLLWNLIIFGRFDHFANSEYSARHQQLGWQAEGKLITYHDLGQSLLHYIGAVAYLLGPITETLLVIAFFYFLYLVVFKKKSQYLALICLSSPFFFYIFTLFLGNSILFVPGITPESIGREMFNLRYGLIMLPYAAVSIPLVCNINKKLFFLMLLLLVIQYGFMIKLDKVMAHVEGTRGIASRTAVGSNDIEKWMLKNYDGGLILSNTYYGAMDIMNINVPLNVLIYEGSGKYWKDSLVQPDKHANWVVLRKSEKDPAWVALRGNKIFQTKFKEVYSSGDSAIYKKIQ